MSKQRQRTNSAVEQLYDFLANEEDARVCKAISEEACQEVPANFIKILISNTLTKIGDRLASPKTTLAWLMESVAAPPLLTGFLVPIRESGSLLPQLVIGALVRGMPIRKWVWVAGSVGQGLAILGMAFAAMGLTGAGAGWALVGLLTLFSLARGLCSVASKDVMGKTIPKTRRGRLKGWMSSASGALTVAAGALLMLQAIGSADDVTVAQAVRLLIAASLLWIVAAVVYGLVVEFRGATEGGGNALRHALSKLSLIREDAPFRRFVGVRALAIGSGMSAPFIIALAHRDLSGGAIWLPVFLTADGLAAMVSAPVWGRWADTSSKRVLSSAMGATAGLLVTVAVWSSLSPSESASQVFYPVVFFLLGIVHSGVRLGRKTYLVDMAEGNRRTAYVACSNTLIGIFLLIAGALTGLLAMVSATASLFAFAMAALMGMALAMGLEDVSD